MSNIPFPGQRSFKESERRYFFGRDQELWQLKGRLRNNQFVALISPPKMGKTSLLRCGLIPDLREKGFPGKAGSQWKLISIRPEGDPVKALAEALAQPGILSNQRLTPDFMEEISQKLKTNVNGLVELYRSSEFVQFFNLLVIVDPFDSALSNPGINQAELNHFVNLILRAAKNPQVAVYGLFSLSTTSLPLTSRLPEFVEAINQSSFHLHPLNQAELETAILRPLEIAGVKMEDSLVKFLVEQLAFEPEQLSKLQDYLWKTWWEWKNEQGQDVIKKNHYHKAIGAKGAIVAKARVADEDEPPPKIKKSSLAKSLLDELQDEDDGEKDQIEEAPMRSAAELAAETYASFSPKEKTLCKKIFQALTIIQKDGSPIARPRSFIDLEHILDADEANIRNVIQPFVQRSALFAGLPSGEQTLQFQNEKILEEWDALKEWMEEERENSLIYLNIAKRAERYFLEDDQEALLKGNTLKEAVQWKNSHQLSHGWGEQYHKKFNLAMEFLNVCQEQEGQAPTAPPPPSYEPEPAYAPEPMPEPEPEPLPPPQQPQAPPAMSERPKIVIRKKDV